MRKGQTGKDQLSTGERDDECPPSFCYLGYDSGQGSPIELLSVWRFKDYERA
ncbi:hypothetical protein MUO79_00990 [Candidatus Bathyarchaeota archaeon]|nr:hypothetical protein [Candidatus Bathyarchaeota archaeon]